MLQHLKTVLLNVRQHWIALQPIGILEIKSGKMTIVQLVGNGKLDLKLVNGNQELDKMPILVLKWSAVTPQHVMIRIPALRNMPFVILTMEIRAFANPANILRIWSELRLFLLRNNWQFLNNWKTLRDCKRTNFNNIKGYIECINTCVKLDNDLNIKAPDHRIRKLSLKFAGVI